MNSNYRSNHWKAHSANKLCPVGRPSRSFGFVFPDLGPLAFPDFIGFPRNGVFKLLLKAGLCFLNEDALGLGAGTAGEMKGLRDSASAPSDALDG